MKTLELFPSHLLIENIAVALNLQFEFTMKIQVLRGPLVKMREMSCEKKSQQVLAFYFV